MVLGKNGHTRDEDHAKEGRCEILVDWVSGHVVAALLAAGAVFAVTHVFSNRKSLFRRYKKGGVTNK